MTLLVDDAAHLGVHEARRLLAEGARAAVAAVHAGEIRVLARRELHHPELVVSNRVTRVELDRTRQVSEACLGQRELWNAISSARSHPPKRALLFCRLKT